MLNVYEQIAANKRRSLAVIVFFIIFVSLGAYILGEATGYGWSYVGFGLILGGFGSFVSYWYSDQIILAMSGARPADRQKDFLFYTVAENLAMAAQLPKPSLYVIEDTAMNAFATGRDPDHAVVCATSGLLGRLNRTELEGVIAHELSHIRYYDMRLMSLVTILVGMITLMADWFWRMSSFRRRNDREGGQVQGIVMLLAFVLALLSPFIAQLIKLAISRRREYQADAGSVMLTRQPSGLISALQKLAADREPLEAANKATAHLYIVNPLKNRHDSIGWFAGLFNTHPPINDRIRQLKEMT